jgi:hypothetical protein
MSCPVAFLLSVTALPETCVLYCALPSNPFLKHRTHICEISGSEGGEYEV